MGPIRQDNIAAVSHASLKIRVFAFLLDYLVIAIYGIVVVGAISFLLRPVITPLFSNSPIVAELTGFFMITLPASLYFILGESSKWQGTWGKRKMGIRVVDSAGRRIEFGRSVVRTAVKFIPWEIAHFSIWRLMLPSSFSETAILIMLGAVNLAALLYLASPLTNAKRMTVYDWVAGTEVIR